MASVKNFDLVVLGAGSAGFNAARVARDLGKRVAIVDGARQLGGLCILRGCMPSKTLLWPAEILHLARKGSRFGLRIPIAEVDMRALRRRKRAIIADFASHRSAALESGRFDLRRSMARFVSEHTVELDDGTRLRGQRFLIGTGSRVAVPPVPGLAKARCWTSDDVLDLDHVPPSVIVLGGGVVACELTQFLRRIGSKVIQIQRSPRILREHSAEASAVVEQAFRDEGVELHTHTRLEQVHARARDFEVTFTELSTGRSLTRRAARLVNALGRVPNTEGLGLEAAGVKVLENGRIATNKWQQTSQPHIYAGGDVAGPHDIVHLAVAQGELAARHAFGVKGLRPVDPSLLLGVAFTDPQLASIGLSESSLKEAGKNFLSASYPFNDHGKSILMDANYGFVKVIAEPRTGRLLGAEIVGKDAGELIHCFNTALALKASVRDMLGAPWYHPTLAEIITYPLEEIADAL